jgi:hypothetical protein
MRIDWKLHGDKRAGLKEKWDRLGYLHSLVRRDIMEG